MRTIPTIVLAAALLICVFVPSGVFAADKLQFVFATVEEGRNILTAKDSFIEQLSPFDRSCRMRTDRDVPEKEFLDFVAQNVRSWEKEEEDRIRSIITTIQPKIDRFAPMLPRTIYLIKTTGNEEGGVAYTRGNAVIFPEKLIGGGVLELYKLFSHELFHVITRRNTKLRDELYGVIGFKKCPLFEFPKTLKPRKITNPDAPMNDHCISVKAGKQKLWVVPVLYSNVERYSKVHGEEFFDYLQVAFLAVARDNGPGRKPTLLKSKEPQLYSEEKLGGFYEQIGKNTDYTIHPEEILADNFSYLFFGITELQSPEIIEKMEKVLEDHKKRITNDQAPITK